MHSLRRIETTTKGANILYINNQVSQVDHLNLISKWLLFLNPEIQK